MKAVTAFLICLLLVVPVWAADTEVLEEAIPESAESVLGTWTVGDVLSGKTPLSSISEWFQANLKGMLSEAAKSAATVVTAALFCSLAKSMGGSGNTQEFVLLGGALAIMGCCGGNMQSFLGQTATALEELSDFSKALLPCIAAASVSTGNAVSGSAKYALSALFTDILMTVGNRCILPVIYAFAALSAAKTALPVGTLDAPVRLIRWGCRFVLTALTTVFTVCLSLTGVITGNADKLAGGLTKTALSAALPVVGSILSDAAETYLAGAKLLRGAVGVLGLFVVLGVCLRPFLALALHYILFRAAECLAEPFSDGRLSELIGSVAEAYGMALGLLGSGAVMLFVAVVLGTEALTG